MNEAQVNCPYCGFIKHFNYNADGLWDDYKCARCGRDFDIDIIVKAKKREAPMTNSEPPDTGEFEMPPDDVMKVSPVPLPPMIYVLKPEDPDGLLPYTMLAASERKDERDTTYLRLPDGFKLMTEDRAYADLRRTEIPEPMTLDSVIGGTLDAHLDAVCSILYHRPKWEAEK